MSYFYVISPVGADPDYAAKREVLKDMGRSRGCEPFFPLDHHSEFSIDSARLDLQRARFVFADLSYERPSCYFELGLAEVLDSIVVIIAAAGTPIHQVGDVKTICWYSDLEEYRRLVAEALATRGFFGDEVQSSDKVRVAGGNDGSKTRVH